ncbi:MAG: hypothetical protein GX801_08970 [Fibrobacter sp.]|nr:hypothetical protein [Fibrobacter sp.]
MIWQVAFFFLVLAIFFMFFKMLQMNKKFETRQQERRDFELSQRRSAMLGSKKDSDISS